MNSKYRFSGNLLRVHREAAGLSQEELAQLAGLDVESILAFQADADKVTASDHWKLCGALKVQPYSLIDGC